MFKIPVSVPKRLFSAKLTLDDEIFELYNKIKEIWLTINSIHKNPLIEVACNFIKQLSSVELKNDLGNVDFSHMPESKIVILKKLLKYTTSVKLHDEIASRIQSEINRISDPLKRINELLSLSREFEFLKSYCLSEFATEISLLHKIISPRSAIDFLEFIIVQDKLEGGFLKCALEALEQAIKALDRPQRIQRLIRLVNETKSSELLKWFADVLISEIKLLANTLDSREKVIDFFSLAEKSFLGGSFKADVLGMFVELDSNVKISEIAASLLMEKIPSLSEWGRFYTLKNYLKFKKNEQFYNLVLLNIKKDLEAIADPVQRVKRFLELPWWKDTLETELENSNLELGSKLILLYQLMCYEDSYTEDQTALISHLFTLQMNSLSVAPPGETTRAIFEISRTPYKIELLATILQQKDINHTLEELVMFFLKMGIRELDVNSRIEALEHLLNYKANVVLYNYALSELKKEISVLAKKEQIPALDRLCNNENPELRDYSRLELRRQVSELEEAEDRINVLNEIIDSEGSSEFETYKIERLKKEINKLSVIERIEALETSLYEDESSQLFIYAKQEILNELALLPVEDRVEKLREYICHSNIGFRQYAHQALYSYVITLPPKDKNEFLFELSDEEISILDETFIRLLEDAIVHMDINEKMEILLNPIGNPKKTEFKNALEKILHKEIKKASKVIKSIPDMQALCVNLENPLRIMLLQKFATYQENRFNDGPRDSAFREIAFEVLGIEINSIEGKVKKINPSNLSDLIKCTSEAMTLFLIEVCSDQDEKRRTSLLKNIAITIDQFFLKNKCTAEDIAALLDIISEGNLELYYDYGRQYEYKNILFKEIINRLLGELNRLRLDNSFFSVNTIAIILYTLRYNVWEQPIVLPENFIEGLVKRSEILFDQGEEFDPSDSFMILDALQNLHYTPNEKKPTVLSKYSKMIISGPQFIAELAKIALPLLTSFQDGPFRAFNDDYKIATRCSMILQMIPRQNFSINPRLFHEAIKSLNRKYESFPMTDVYRLLPDEMVPNRELIIALEENSSISGAGRISTTTFKLPEQDQNHELHLPNLQFRRPDGRHISNHLQHLKENLKVTSFSKNPRTLVWLLKKYSEGILANLRSGNFSFFSEDIIDYLQTVRNHMLDVSDATISASISELCKELISNIAELTPDMAIRLLWLNMVLSTTSGRKELAFTIEQQAVLFSLIKNMTIDKQQARTLFEIRTMGWHGGVSFSHQLKTQMDVHFKTFGEDSNPSKEEDLSYREIEKNLHASNKKFLEKQGFICPISSHEIDIAYIEKDKKIAINIDGPCHFDSITHQYTMKTIFRNICLKRAGWDVIDVDLTIGDYLQRCGGIAANLNKLFPKTSPVPQTLTAPANTSKSMLNQYTQKNSQKKSSGERKECEVKKETGTSLKTNGKKYTPKKIKSPK